MTPTYRRLVIGLELGAARASLDYESSPAGPPPPAPDVVPLATQPVPVQHFCGEIAGVTALTRVWAPGESRLCRLCPAGKCGADHELGVCLVLTRCQVTDPARHKVVG